MQVDLGRFSMERIERAIEAAIQNVTKTSDSLPPLGRLEESAKATLTTPSEPTSTYFQSILEIAYLVASADGFVEKERWALSKVLERVMEHTVDTETLELHFRDLDAACEMLGRRERLRRVAEDFVGGDYRREVLGFATIVALADGALAEPESAALIQVGEYFGLARDRVAELVDEIVELLVALMEGDGEKA